MEAIIIIAWAFLSFAALFAAVGLVFTLASPRAAKRSWPGTCDFLIILGCAAENGSPSEELRLRIEAARAYLEQNPACVAVASGGNARQGQLETEARVIERELARAGIEQTRIIREDRARNTYENMAYSLQIIHGTAGAGAAPRIGIATSDYHVFRSLRIARMYHLQAAAVAAKSPARCFKSRAREYIMFYHYIFRWLQMKLCRGQVPR